MAVKNLNKAQAAVSAVKYVEELKAMLDDVGALIAKAAERGYRPSFIVSYGTIRSVSTSPLKEANDPRGRKPANSDIGEEFEEEI